MYYKNKKLLMKLKITEMIKEIEKYLVSLGFKKDTYGNYWLDLLNVYTHSGEYFYKDENNKEHLIGFNSYCLSYQDNTFYLETVMHYTRKSKATTVQGIKRFLNKYKVNNTFDITKWFL